METVEKKPWNDVLNALEISGFKMISKRDDCGEILSARNPDSNLAVTAYLDKNGTCCSFGLQLFGRKEAPNAKIFVESEAWVKDIERKLSYEISSSNPQPINF